jgi:3-phosphoshikimate 1-carboxyvinyltransferase
MSTIPWPQPGKFVRPHGPHPGRSFRLRSFQTTIGDRFRAMALVFSESRTIGTRLVLTQGDSEWYRLVKPPLAVGTRFASDRNQGGFFCSFPKDGNRSVHTQSSTTHSGILLPLTPVNTIEIHPLDRAVDGTIEVPGSKSYTNRALIIAALSDGETVLEGALFSDDTHFMAEALRRLGINVVEDPASARFTIQGCGGRIPADSAELFIGNSGTTARFLTAFVGLGHGQYVIDGIDRMRERPIQDLLDGLKPLGVTATSETGNGCPPIRVEGTGIQGGRTFMPGDRSSQYFTALLMASPYAKQDVEIRVTGDDLISKPYLDMTIDIMAKFGVQVVNDSYNTFTVQAGQRYRPQTYQVEPDATNATYFFAAAAITGGRILVRHLSRCSSQGDVRFVEILERMGCRIEDSNEGIEVHGPERLRGIDVDMNDTPDAAQTLCAIAPFADSPVTIRNVGSMRIKETDRIAAMETELTRLGITVETWSDGLRIHPTDTILPAAVDTYDDHRMAMSLSLIGLRAKGLVIKDPECVTKTFPTYFETLAKIQPE